MDQTQIIHETVIKIKTVLDANLTDPRSATRPPDKELVLTAYPEEAPYYPVVVVFQITGRADRLCGNADMFETVLRFSIDVFAKSTRILDTLCDDVQNQIRSNLDEFRTFGMYAMKQPVLFREQPMTERGVHKKTAEYEWKLYVG